MEAKAAAKENTIKDLPSKQDIVLVVMNTIKLCFNWKFWFQLNNPLVVVIVFSFMSYVNTIKEEINIFRQNWFAVKNC